MVQNNLKIVAYGTQTFLDKYSKPLIKDCNKFGYDIHIGVIPKQTHISHINCTILKHTIEHIRTSNTRICILDPECRIVKPIPREWIYDIRPVVFEKSNELVYEYEKEFTGYAYIGQPLICSKQDLPWLEWWYQAVISMKQNNIYPPNETMLLLSLKFNNVKTITKTICYNRDYEGTYDCVKGNWNNDDVIFQHPCIHSALDKDILPASTQTRKDVILSQRDLHNHFNNYETIKQIDELMFKEKTNIKDWPKGTKLIRINTEDWYTVEDWYFNIETGQIRHKDYPLVKYHHSIEKKLKLKIATPWTEQYNKHNGKN